MLTRTLSALSLCFILATTCLSSQAAELKVGDAMPAIELPDQHETKAAVDKSTRIVILAFEMPVAKALNQWLDARGKDYLPGLHALFIADISGMPGPIAKMFAVPKMKKYSHQILLAREDDFKLRFPVKKDHATILHLSATGTIEKISYAASGDGLKTAIE